LLVQSSKGSKLYKYETRNLKPDTYVSIINPVIFSKIL